jgi:hypothetical protein
VHAETFCPYQGLVAHPDVVAVPDAAFSYASPSPEAERIIGHLCFQPDLLDVRVDRRRLLATGGQEVIPPGPDRDLIPDELRATRSCVIAGKRQARHDNLPHRQFMSLQNRTGRLRRLTALATAATPWVVPWSGWAPCPRSPSAPPCR